jgi:NAD(P)-dependent dehydrogenase (short-subunit alcohol dehydrogenase family)
MVAQSSRYSPELLSGQVALVTGAGSQYGIGRSIVLALAGAGAAVIYASDLNDGNFESLKKAVASINPKTVFEGRSLNVASEEETLVLLKEIIKAHGRFDLYFPNAGYVDVK